MLALIVPFFSDVPFLFGAGLSSFVTWKVARWKRHR